MRLAALIASQAALAQSHALLGEGDLIRISPMTQETELLEDPGDRVAA